MTVALGHTLGEQDPAYRSSLARFNHFWRAQSFQTRALEASSRQECSGHFVHLAEMHEAGEGEAGVNRIPGEYPMICKRRARQRVIESPGSTLHCENLSPSRHFCLRVRTVILMMPNRASGVGRLLLLIVDDDAGNERDASPPCFGVPFSRAPTQKTSSGMPSSVWWPMPSSTAALGQSENSRFFSATPRGWQIMAIGKRGGRGKRSA